MAMELKTTGVNGFVKPAELTNMETLLNAVNDELLTGKGAGSDFLGWLDLPVNYDKEEFARIQKAAKKDPGRQRCAGCHRHRRLVPRRARGH